MGRFTVLMRLRLSACYSVLRPYIERRGNEAILCILTAHAGRVKHKPTGCKGLALEFVCDSVCRGNFVCMTNQGTDVPTKLYEMQNPGASIRPLLRAHARGQGCG